MSFYAEEQRQVKEVLQFLARQIPKTLNEIDKQAYINKEIIDRLAEKEHQRLKNFVESILIQMRIYEASDIEMGGLGSKGMVWLRIHGHKKPFLEFGRYTPDEFNILLHTLLLPNQAEKLLQEKSIDLSYTINTDINRNRYRANIYFELGELALNMRAVNATIRPFKDYELDHNVIRMMNLVHTKQGLILITGITGSGKSTTLDSIIDLNNRASEGHIIIIASPIEYIHTSNRCIIRHREVGKDTNTFKQGTIESLRQDPDIIMIGEMRDPETIMAALEAADTGHKVFSTLHTASAVESIDRIIAEVPPEEQMRVRYRLADTLTCVMSQRLVPGIDRRLVLTKEIMVMTPSIKAAIKNNNTSEIYQMINEGQNLGMITMERDLHRLFTQKKINIENAYNYANNKRRMQQLLQPMH